MIEFVYKMYFILYQVYLLMGYYLLAISVGGDICTPNAKGFTTKKVEIA